MFLKIFIFMALLVTSSCKDFDAVRSASTIPEQISEESKQNSSQGTADISDTTVTDGGAEGGGGGAKPQTPPPTEISLEEFADKINVAVEPDEPEVYRLKLSWPRIIDNPSVRVKTDRVLSITDNDVTSLEYKFAHNQLVSFSFEVVNAAEQVLTSTIKKIQIPRDYVVREGNNNLNLIGPVKINRLYLSNAIPALHFDQKLHLEVNEIYSEGGLIAAFPPEAQAGVFSPGRSAGDLNLKIKKLFGKIKIQSRGEAGGKGLTGPAWTTRAPQGAPAGWAEKHCWQHCEDVCVGRNCFNSTITTLLSLKPLRRTCSTMCDRNCPQGAPHGGPGEKGQAGIAGAKGFIGGNSGKVVVHVDQIIPIEDPAGSIIEKQNFVLVESIPGAGGQGGDPGPPQEGGIGGVAPPGHECPGSQGPPGPVGDVGLQGPQGDSGSKNSVCITLISEAYNVCTQ